MSQPRAPEARNTTAAQIPEAIGAMAKRIVRVANPLQVILFGSHARGDAHRWSDVDFLVVIPNAADKQRVWDETWDALRGFRVSHDVVVSTPEELRRRGNLVGMILRPALQDGRILYDATAAVKWDPAGRRVKLEVDPVTEEDRLAQTRQWLDEARSDLAVADMVLASGKPGPGPACYHAQQAGEKALKAVYVFLQVQYAFTHDLDLIREDIPRGWDLRAEFGNLKKLSGWSFKARYPGDWAPPTRTDAEEATRLAHAIYESVLRDLRAHGFPDEGGG